MEDLLPLDFISDPYTRQVVMAIGFLIGITILWFIWKFFYTIFKHVLVGLFMLVIGSVGYWYFRSSEPPRPPEVGKHVYGVSSKRYLGVVQSVQRDGSKVTFGVREPGGQIKGYQQGYVELEEKMREVEPLPTPAPSPTLNSNPRPRRRN
ncbi:MAG: hypothetical protein HOP19_25670 [Acidobacteria bacterium]|nr:hypothetical protein [Acidobacteriota bacterium]